MIVFQQWKAVWIFPINHTNKLPGKKSNKKQIEKQGLKPLTQPIIRKQIDFEVNCKIPLGDNIRHSVLESFPYKYLKYIIDISNKTALFLSDVVSFPQLEEVISPHMCRPKPCINGMKRSKSLVSCIFQGASLHMICIADIRIHKRS